MAAIAAYHAPIGGLSVGKPSSYTFPPVLRPEKLMLSGGSGCDPITSSPLDLPSPLGVKAHSSQGLSGTATLQGGLRPSHSSGS